MIIFTCIQVDNVPTFNSGWDLDADISVDCDAIVPCTINIPDANFKAALLTDSSINSNNDGEIQCSEASAFTGAINVTGISIMDFTGISAFTALTGFEYDNYTGGPTATSLDLSANASLTTVSIKNTKLSSLNIKNGNNSIISQFILAHNPFLNCVQVDNATAAHSGWRPDDGVYYSEDCALPAPCAVTIPDELLRFYLLYDANANSNNDGVLQCSEAAAFTGELFFNATINDFTGIEAFTAVTILRFYYMPATSLNLTQNTSLLSLTVYGTQTETLDLSSNTALTSLYVQNTQVATLDLSGNTALTSLVVFSNSQLMSLNVQNGNNTYLTTVNALENPLLTCIKVDDPYAPHQYWSIPNGVSFSLNCALPTCVVNIPDASFKGFLLNDTNINTNGDGVIDCLEASSFTGSIDLENLNPSDLTGIEAFTALTSFRSNVSQAPSMDFSANVSLTYLVLLNNNQLTSLNIQNGNNSILTI